MTDKEKLKAVIEYAVKKGYGSLEGEIEVISRYKHGVWGLSINEVDGIRGMDFRSDSDVFFSHDFAKAVFGEEVEHDFVDDKCINCELIHGAWGGSLCKDGWQYYLQQAVISEDPIDYYYQFVINQSK